MGKDLDADRVAERLGASRHADTVSLAAKNRALRSRLAAAEAVVEALVPLREHPTNHGYEQLWKRLDAYQEVKGT